MNSLLLSSVSLVFVGLVSTGCDNQLKDGNAALLKDNEALRTQLADKTAELDAANSRLDDATASEGAMEEAITDASAFDGIEGVTATVVGNEIHISIEGDVLFDSGKDSIRSDSRKSLDKVTNAIAKNHPGALIRVAGFTDTDPIKKSGYKSNYHLGFARAYAVREYLVTQGLESKMISLSSFGPDAPRDTKAKSRRVEVVVVSQS